MRSQAIPFFGLTLLLAACASGSGSGEGESRRDPDLITAEELSTLGPGDTAHDAIRRLRTNWLTGRGGRTRRVFVDSNERGGIGVLQTYRVNAIRELRLISSLDATRQWGAGFPSGVIQIITR